MLDNHKKGDEGGYFNINPDCSSGSSWPCLVDEKSFESKKEQESDLGQ